MNYVLASVVIYLIFVFIAVIAVFLPLKFVGKRSLDKRPQNLNDVLNERIDYILKKRNFFLINSICWMICFYAISVLCAFSNVIVLFLCAYGKDCNVCVFVFSSISMCMTIFIMAVNPYNYYAKFRKAFRTLDNVINSIENEFVNEKKEGFISNLNNIVKKAISNSEDDMDD